MVEKKVETSEVMNLYYSLILFGIRSNAVSWRKRNVQ